jgi:hypothetical protein
LDNTPPPADTNQTHEVKASKATTTATNIARKELKKPAPLQIVSRNKRTTTSKVPHPRKSSARLGNQPISASKTTSNVVARPSINNSGYNDKANMSNNSLRMATSGFEAHRRKRLAAATTAAAALASSSSNTAAAAAKNSTVTTTNMANVIVNEDENTQAVRFRVKKNANYDTLRSAIFQSLIRKQLPAEVLASRTLVFRCPNGNTIPLTDDEAVAAAFKQCKGKITLTCA